MVFFFLDYKDLDKSRSISENHFHELDIRFADQGAHENAEWQGLRLSATVAALLISTLKVKK